MENAIKLTDDYYFESDGRMNLILYERYEKREGRGKSAELSGEFGFRDIGFFRSLEQIANYLVRLEVFKYEGSELEGIVDRIESFRDEIVEVLSVNHEVDFSKAGVEE